MDKKWTIGLGLLGILIVFLLLWNFAPAIQRWLASVFVDIILLLAAFAAFLWFISKKHVRCTYRYPLPDMSYRICS